MITAARKVYSVSLLCRVLQVSRSGYYSWCLRGKSPRESEYEQLIPLVRSISRISRYLYGSRRISLHLTAMGYICGRHKAKTLMVLSGVKAKQKRKFKTTTTSNHSLPAEPNVLARNFEADAPDRAYVSDITYIRTFEGWFYLAVVLDLYSRRVVGWSFSNRMDKSLVLNALQMAYWRRKPAGGLLFHSDRGSQYCSGSFQMF